jgi:hypothetical protein
MRVKSIQGGVLAAAAVALLAGCGGESAERAAPAPAPPAAVDAPVEPAAQPAPVEPAAEPSTKAPTPTPTRPQPKPKLPDIGTVSSTPQLSCADGWCALPAGAGTVTFRAQVTGARQVEFFVVPTGNETWEFRRSIGVDRDGTDGWAVTWAYDAKPLLAHLTLVARGPGGTVQESPLNLYRE